MHPNSPRSLRGTTPPTLAACVLLGLVAAACSSSNKTTSTSATSETTSTTAATSTSAGVSSTTGAGVTGTLTTIRRADGTTQVVIDGHPLSTFAADGKPGDTSGQEVAQVWYAVTPQGTAAGDES